jgi:hypothetical protein
MIGSIHIAYMLPLYHLAVVMRFFQSSRLGFVAKIYPFLGFESLIEYLLKSIIPIPTYRVHTTCSLENPLLGFFPLQHIHAKELPWSSDTALNKNTCKVWLPS